MSNKLKTLRKEKGLTQADLAKVLNTNQSQYGKYENGKTNLSIENAKILAEYFGVSIPYLLGLDNDSCIDRGKKMTPFQLLVRGENMNNFLFDKPENRLDLLMQKNKYTLKKLSDDTGIPITTLSGYKKNLRTPKKENAKILAEYFGVSIPYLLGYEENSTANKTNATISTEFVKKLSFISEKKSKLLQEYIELDKKERDIIKQIKEIVR